MTQDGLRETFLTVEQAAETLQTTPRALHERTRARAIPMVKRRGMRRVLIPATQLERWMHGADLEVIETSDGSVIVKTVETVAA